MKKTTPPYAANHPLVLKVLAAQKADAFQAILTSQAALVGATPVGIHQPGQHWFPLFEKDVQDLAESAIRAIVPTASEDRNDTTQPIDEQH